MLQLSPHIVAFSQQDKHLLQGLSAVGAGSIAQAIAWRQQPVILDLSHNQLEGTGGLHDTFCGAMLRPAMSGTEPPLDVSLAVVVSHQSTHVKRCTTCRPLRGTETSSALVHMPGHQPLSCNCTGDQELNPLLVLVCTAAVRHHNARCAGLWLSNSGRGTTQSP